MKKGIISLLTAAIMTISLAGCGAAASSGTGNTNSVKSAGSVSQVSEASTASADDGSQKTIGLLVPTVEAEYFVGIEKNIESGLKDQNYKFSEASYDWSADKEIQCVENFVVQGVDAIVVVTFDNAADSAFKAAMDKDIKVIVAGTQTENYTYDVISDNVSIGQVEAKMAADWIKKNLDGKAKIAILTSEASVSGADRAKGMEAYIKKNLPDSEVVLSQDPGSDTGSGQEFAENLLTQFPDVNVVLTISDDRAIEVYEAFKAANHAGDDVAIYGCDCNQQALENIKNGTCYRGSVNTGNYGNEIVKVLPKILSGDTSIGNQTVCKGEGVTIDNVDDYLK